jgi:hypothetical protein
VIGTVRVEHAVPGAWPLLREVLPDRDASQSAAISTIEEEDPVPIATRNPAMSRRSDEIQTNAASPREGIIGALSAGLLAAVAAGDLDTARVVNEAIGKLLGLASAPTATGTVPELAERRPGR